MKDQYIGLDEDNFAIISNRHKNFQACLNDKSTAPVQVFNPLLQKNMDELDLIRAVSKELQAKKEEDIKKAAQARAAEKSEDKSEDGKEDKSEDGKDEKANDVKGE